MRVKYKLKELQFSPEGQYLDRKSARKKPSELLKHLIGFANADGGQLIIGIEDEKQGNIITGFKDSKAYPISEFEKIGRELQDGSLELGFERIPVMNHNEEADQILVISVEVSSNRVVVSPKDEVFLRQGDETVKLSFEKRQQLIYDRGQRFFEDELVPDASVDEIDENLVKQYSERLGVTDRTTAEVLKARRLMIGENITKAGILLFGKNPSSFLPQARVRFIRFEGTEMGLGAQFNIVKDVTFEDALPILITKVQEFIKTQLREFQYLDENGVFQPLSEYPEFAWFEGLVNAVTHRDYSVYGDYIRILMFDDRLEIHSAGKLPNIVTVENIQHERFSRNPRIARILTEFGWVREMNEGVKRIYSEMEQAFLHAPVYSVTENKVILRLENNIVSRHLRSQDALEMKLNDFIDLTTDEQTILHYMYNSGERMTTAKASELTERSRKHAGKILKKLEGKAVLKWHGNSKNDSKQYYTLCIK